MKITKILPILFVAYLLASCVDNLEEININPNAAQIPQPDYLLSNAIKSSVNTYWGTTNNLDGTLLFAQHVAKIQYTEIDRYIASNSTFESPWRNFYSQGLRDLAEVIKIGETENNQNYTAVASIFRSWVFLLLTDAYGDIPYTQAINIDEFITPAYDAQKDVYLGLLTDLKNAAVLLDPSKKAIAGDIIYSGDLAKWKKFAHSLRYRIALRIADKEPETAKQVIAEIPVADLIGDGDIAQLDYLTSPNQNPIALFFETRDDYRVSNSIIETLKSLNDPRLPVFANKTETPTEEEYIGVPNGLTNSAASALGFSKTSKIGTYFTTAQTPSVILSPAEVLFGRAEAAARGFTSEDAEALYNQAIKASLKQFGITDDEVADAYLEQPLVKFNSANFRESIGVQKWIALFGQGLEAFAEWRRLDYPQLQPAVAGVLDGEFVVRYFYPGTEQSLNGESYKAAVANQGVDALTTKLWFDAY
jgi:hypothetical protein